MVENKEALISWFIMLGYGSCCLYMIIMTIRLTMAWVKLHVKQMVALALFYCHLSFIFFIFLFISSPFYLVATNRLKLTNTVGFSEVSPLLYIQLIILIGIFVSGFMVDYYMRASENE